MDEILEAVEEIIEYTTDETRVIKSILDGHCPRSVSPPAPPGNKPRKRSFSVGVTTMGWAYYSSCLNLKEKAEKAKELIEEEIRDEDRGSKDKTGP